MSFSSHPLFFIILSAAYRTMAPEVVRHGKYSVSADTFSWAMIVNELFTEEKPYEFLIPLEAAVGVVKRGLRPSQKRIKCERLRNVIAAAWDQDPSRRPPWPTIIRELEAARQEMCNDSGVGGARPRKHSIASRGAGLSPSASTSSSLRRSMTGLGLGAGGGRASASTVAAKGGGGGKPTIGSLFRKMGSGNSGSGKSKREKGDKSRRTGGHQLPMDEDHMT